MLTESFFSAICGPPLASNTAVAKDVGIYAHTLRPGYAVKSTFKKSSVPVNCLAVSDAHVFAAQHEKAYVHVYSRLRGNQEAFVPLPERVRCLSLAGDVLILGTEDGRIMLWEVRSPCSPGESRGFWLPAHQPLPSPSPPSHRPSRGDECRRRRATSRP